MVKASPKILQEVEDLTKATDDYKERLSRVIEEEGDRIRREADQESAVIINKSREKYKQRLSQVIAEEGYRIRREAEQKAAEMITKAKEEKERILTTVMQLSWEG